MPRYTIRILLASASILFSVHATTSMAQVEDIVVTARKTEETLQRVPISVSAFDQTLIQRYDISDLADVAARTPNFSFSNNLGLFGGVPVIRGVGAPRTGGNSSVGVFIDGVDTGNSAGINLQSFDVARIEVVRGPQSTQFGRGVMAGAINYVSRRPNLERLEMEASGEIAEYDQYRVEARVSGPVSDRFAVSFAGQYRSFGGFYENSVSGKSVGDTNSYALVGGARLKFGSDDQGEAYLRVAYSQEYLNQPAWHQVATNTQTGALPSQRWFVGRLTADPAKIAHNGDSYRQINLEFFRTAFHFDYDFGGASLRSITAYNRSSQDQDTDADFTAYPDLIVGGNLLGNFRSVVGVEIEDWSQELRLQSSGDGPFKWMVGGYFRNEDYTSLDNSPTAAQGCSCILAPVPNSLWRTTKTLGIFGSVGYEITEGLTISQELRYSQDKIDEASQPRAAASKTSFGATFKNWLPRTILEWQVDRDRMLYASVAKGNKPGGFNNSAGAGFGNIPDELKPYDEESMWVYEAGFKTAWFDRRLTLNGAVFYIDWQDMQVNSQVIVNGTPTGLTVNAGKANGLGFEGELRFEPNEYVDVYGGIGYAPIRIIDYVDTRARNAGITTDGSDQIAGTPDWTGNLGAIGYLPLGGGRAFLQGDLKYRSTTYATEANLAETGAKTTFDAQLGFTNDKLRASVYVNNLFDDDTIDSARAYVNPTNYARSFIVQVAAPRQFGVRLSYKY